MTSRLENLAKSLSAEAIRRIPCSRMSADIFGYKTGIARCYESSKKVQAKLIFRTTTVYGIEKNIGVDDERHCVLLHRPFKSFAIGQVDSGPTISKTGRPSACSDFGAARAAKPSAMNSLIKSVIVLP